MGQGAPGFRQRQGLIPRYRGRYEAARRRFAKNRVAGGAQHRFARLVLVVPKWRARLHTSRRGWRIGCGGMCRLAEEAVELHLSVRTALAGAVIARRAVPGS